VIPTTRPQATATENLVIRAARRRPAEGARDQ